MPISYLSIVIAALVALIIRSFWYSPLAFGGVWLRLRGRDPKEVDTMGLPAQNMIIEFVCALVTAYVLGIFTTVFGAHTAYSAILLAIIVWLGFYVAIRLSEVLWEDTPFGLFLLNAGLRLVNIILMTLIVGLWQ